MPAYSNEELEDNMKYLKNSSNYKIESLLSQAAPNK